MNRTHTYTDVGHLDLAIYTIPDDSEDVFMVFLAPRKFDLVSRQSAHSKLQPLTLSLLLAGTITVAVYQSASLCVSQNCSQFFSGLPKK